MTKNIKISIPTPLREYVNNNKEVEINATSVNSALENLVENYPKLRDHLYENGELRNFVNIYLNDEDVRYMENEHETELTEDDEIAIIPSIAGGIK